MGSLLRAHRDGVGFFFGSSAIHFALHVTFYSYPFAYSSWTFFLHTLMPTFTISTTYVALRATATHSPFHVSYFRPPRHFSMS